MNRIEKKLKWLEDWVIRLDKEINKAHIESEQYAKKQKVREPERTRQKRQRKDTTIRRGKQSR